MVGDGEFYGGNYDPVNENKVGLDMNVFNGNIASFNAKYGIGEIVVPPTTPTKIRIIARQPDGMPGWLFFRDEASFDYQEQLAIGYGNELELLSPEPVNGLWHVKTARGREGFVSAGSAYTEVING
jgi:hypothetical protein